jgi:hypothetical protein
MATALRSHAQCDKSSQLYDIVDRQTCPCKAMGMAHGGEQAEFLVVIWLVTPL